MRVCRSMAGGKFINDNSYRSNKIILLLTDGEDYVSDSVLQSSVDAGVKIYTIGIGSDYGYSTLQHIADYTSGEFYIAKTAEDIVDIYSNMMLLLGSDLTTDTNGDGLPDIFETAGMRLSNGEIIYTDPLKSDTDGDGLSDGEEIIPQFKFVNSSWIGLSGISCGVYFEMNSDPTMKDTDGDGYGDNDDLAPMRPYKTPVILLHGRADNSYTCFGLESGIKSDDNNNYNCSLSISGKDYSSVKEQSIVTDNIQKGSIGNSLISHGYIANYNLFVFNYPNQDFARANAKKFNVYINNLIVYAQKEELKSYLYPTAGAFNNLDFKVDIVAHSFGGLVSRYFIENMNGDEFIRKLITIDTPHYGADMSNLQYLDLLYSCAVGLYPIDIDLRTSSLLFNGNNFIPLIAYDIYMRTYILNNASDTLLGNKDRDIHTDYYTIAGCNIDYIENYTNSIFSLDIDVNHTNIAVFYDSIKSSANSIGIKHLNINEKSGDDVINIDTQLGIKFGDDNFSVQDYVNFEKASIIFNTTNNTNITNSFHCNTLWQLTTQNKVYEYLSL